MAALQILCHAPPLEYAGLKMIVMEKYSIHTTIDSPVGKLVLVSDGDFLKGIYFSNEKHNFVISPSSLEKNDANIFTETTAQLKQYFEGKRKVFNIPVKFDGTDFQKSVWNELLNIPYGETVAYLDIAKKINNPSAVRAVGQTNGKNPLSIIYPCHRVIGSNGQLTGYGGGIQIKKWLLQHEIRYSNKNIQMSLF